MAIKGMLDRLPTSVRVILARWFIYVLAMFPGLQSLQGHLNEAVGKRPWFHDIEMPLTMLDFKMLVAEVYDGVGMLLFGVLFVWVLQLIWLAGAARVLDPQAEPGTKKVFANGRPFLWRYVRIALFALLLALVVHLGVKAVFESMADNAELQGVPLVKSYIDANLWRGGILFLLLSLVGVFIFWMRVITTVTDERKLRFVPRKVFRVFRRRFVSALLLQFAAVVLVLTVQGFALFAWRQSGGGTLWYLVWLLLLLLAAWVWQWRVAAAVRIARASV